MWIFLPINAISQSLNYLVQNLTPANTPLYEKNEIGISLSNQFSNPYNPDVISVESTLVSPNGNTISYKGADDRMQHYFWDNQCNVTNSGGRYSNFSEDDPIEYKNEDVSEQFELFPNPSTDKIQILFSSSNKYTQMSFIISNINGQVVQENILQNVNEGVNSFSIDLTKLSNGFYILSQIGNMQLIRSSKFIINR